MNKNDPHMSNVGQILNEKYDFLGNLLTFGAKNTTEIWAFKTEWAFQTPIKQIQKNFEKRLLRYQNYQNMVVILTKTVDCWVNFRSTSSIFGILV